jgi:peptide deformylase
MVKIIQRENPVLRGKAIKVPLSDIGSKKIKSIIENMNKALDKEDDGIAIAAPQIGEPYRIFIVSRKINFLNEDGSEKSEEEIKSLQHLKNEVYINPEIKRVSREKSLMEEGCLSVRYLYGQVKRSIKATIQAYDEDGKKFTKGAKGLLSQVFQHETDHLDGILFSDKAIDLREMKPETNV